MSFPDGTMHGVDIIIPDFDYVRKIKDKNSWYSDHSCTRRSYRCGALFL